MQNSICFDKNSEPFRVKRSMRPFWNKDDFPKFLKITNTMQNICSKTVD